MTKKRVTRHIHKYIRDKLGKDYTIYKCSFPGCSHYLPPNLVLGKVSVCHVCGEVMIIDRFALTLAKPHHRECTKKKKAEKFDKLKELVERL